MILNLLILCHYFLLISTVISHRSKARRLQLRHQVAYIENTYFPNESSLGLFRLNSIYVDVYHVLGDCSSGRVVNSCLELVELKLKWYGAEVETEITESVSHCILDARYIKKNFCFNLKINSWNYTFCLRL